MTPTVSRTRTPFQFSLAGRKLKRWILRSLAFAPWKPHKPSEPPTDTTISASLSLPPTPELDNEVRTTRSEKVIRDVLPPSDTITKTLHFGTIVNADSLVLSNSSTSNGGHLDDEFASSPRFPVEHPKPSSIPKESCIECESELGEQATYRFASGVLVALQTPLPPSRANSPYSPRDDARSICTSETGHTSKGAGLKVGIDSPNQGTDPRHSNDEKPGDDARSSYPWVHTPTEPDIIISWTDLQALSALPSRPLPAEKEGASKTLRSSDGEMTLALREFLGAGTYGKVVSADWTETRRQVAVKVSHKHFISELDHGESGLKTLRDELEVLKVLKQSREWGELGSNFFPELFKSWQDAKNVYFVMDMYMQNLEELRRADPKWDVGDKILCAAEMILGLQALHGMRILHRDIKPANIFFTYDKHVIIGDYGLARAWLDPFYASVPSTSLRARDSPGTMPFLAPEVIRGFYQDVKHVEVRKYANYGFEADIWSLGVTICESWCQTPGLFRLQEGEEDLDYNSAIPEKILNMEIKPVVKEMVEGHPIWHLITRMLDRNQRTRIGFNEILAHPAFALLDWNRVANLDYTPTWSFPDVKPSKKSKDIVKEVDFTAYYLPPEEIHIDESDTCGKKVEKLAKRDFQILRRAMGAGSEWVSKQQPWIAEEALGQFDFDWTAPEIIDEEEEWAQDDDDDNLT